MARRKADLIKKQISATMGERAGREAILSSIGVGVISTNGQGNIVEVNKVALDMLGYQRKELMGKWFPDTISALNEDGSVINLDERPMTQTFISGKPVSEQTYYKTKKGDMLPVSIVVSPVMLHGKPIGAVEIFRDITTEIANDKLKTDFISIASHQLRTPLSSIYTYSNMLKDGYAGELSDKQLSFLNVIISASARMNELTTTLLNVTRVEAGNITIESKSTDLAKLANSAVTESIPEAIKKNLTFAIDIGRDIPLIKTDRRIVREVLTNLITNAIKYTPPEGSVEVKLYSRKNDVVFRVKDDGYGIPTDAQSRVFTKFFRAPNASQLVPTGTGLGLHLAKMLVEKLNGELWFESRENQGTTFYFSLSKKGSVGRKEKFRLETA